MQRPSRRRTWALESDGRSVATQHRLLLVSEPARQSDVGRLSAGRKAAARRYHCG